MKLQFWLKWLYCIKIKVTITIPLSWRRICNSVHDRQGPGSPRSSQQILLDQFHFHSSWPVWSKTFKKIPKKTLKKFIYLVWAWSWLSSSWSWSRGSFWGDRENLSSVLSMGSLLPFISGEVWSWSLTNYFWKDNSSCKNSSIEPWVNETGFDSLAIETQHHATYLVFCFICFLYKVLLLAVSQPKNSVYSCIFTSCNHLANKCFFWDIW